MIGFQILAHRYFPTLVRQGSEPNVEVHGLREDAPQIVIIQPTPPPRRQTSSQDRCRPEGASQLQHHHDDREPLVIAEASSDSDDEAPVGEVLFERLLKKHHQQFLNISQRRQRFRSL